MAGLSMKSNNPLQQWYHLFKSHSKMRSQHAHQHWKQVIRVGLPTRKDENWKYTALDDLLTHQFVFPPKKMLSQAQVDVLALPIDAIRLVFVNGQYQSSLSATDTDLFVVRHSRDFDKYSLPGAIQPEFFLHLTESLADEVTAIRLSHGKLASRPLYLLHVTTGQSKALNNVHYRHHFEIEEGAQAHVIEHYVTLNGKPHFTGARFSFVVGSNAQLKHIKLAFEESSGYHFAHNDIIVGSNASVNSTSFLLGSGLLRHNTSVQLNGENTYLFLNSLVLPMNAEVADTRSYLEHNKGYCLSRQLHKTITRDKGRAVFNGHIKVAEHALKTDAQMMNNNLLLGYLGEVDTKPLLEIYSDDVKCSHGATVSCIDKEQIFYLRSRGITEEDAQHMIIHAFAADLNEALDDEVLRQAVLQRISACCPRDAL
ncbi:Fe-S cluster assembly protein SufD [Pantoea sp. Nvir]|uniref:Fe-S cluster assembly protein SufD n=1 Tax=Pantoea sp. Nvir TaxID=2576760 RepID=UPI0027F2D9F6|nr:Fe-S cluster assembly protein SufD [Pantoea sp. Nvir]CAJ0991702.1 FeS cluster assembly protein SufD [Pantoea sp. Nvir]